MTNPIRILFITHQFPESGGRRPEKLVKYLPRYGIQPVVLTSSRMDDVAREVLEEEFPPDLKIYRVRSLHRDPFRFLGRIFHSPELGNWLQRFFLFPDFYSYLVVSMTNLGRKLIRQEGIQAIFTTSPPESMQLVGWLLHRLTGLPWISDYRDLWTQKAITFRPVTLFHRKLAKALERRFFEESTAIIANTPRNKQLYLRQFSLPEKKITVVTNGYDPADLPETPAPGQNSRELVLGYLGYLDKEGFPAWELLQMLRQLREEGLALRLLVVGYISPHTWRKMKEMGFTAFVEYHPQMPNFRAVPFLFSRSDLLLVLLYETAYSSAIVPLKTYSYLLMRRPVLAIAPEEGELARILRTTRLGQTISLQHPQAIKDFLRKAYYEKQKQGHLAVTPDEAEWEKFNIISLSRRVADVIRQAVETKESSS